MLKIDADVEYPFSTWHNCYLMTNKRIFPVKHPRKRMLGRESMGTSQTKNDRLKKALETEYPV